MEEGVTLPALKLEEGMSQGMWAAPTRWKRQENCFSPRASRGSQPSDALISGL